jgi:hypothetical protein
MRSTHLAIFIVRLGTAILATAGAFSCVAKGNPKGLNGGGSQATLDAGLGASNDDAGVCIATACAPLECPPEARALPLPGECCPTLCEPSDCSTVDCPPLDCASGMHSVKPNGLCCAACVKNPAPKSGETCAQGQVGYDAYLNTTMSVLGASFCEMDTDCKIVVLDNPCNHGCGTAVAFRTATELQARLSTYASAHCAACEQTSPGCPPVEQFAYCTGGVCSAH